MKIVNVIPIAKGIPHDILSYFTSKKVNTGSLVIVPVRRKKIPAIVVSIEDGKDIKISLKKSNFSLKPVENVKSFSFLAPEFVNACKDVADYFVSPAGAVVKDFIPQAILDSVGSVKSVGFAITTSDYRKTERPARQNTHHEIVLAQAPKKERFQYYRSLIREEFAKNHSVFFCLPTTIETEDFSEELQKGIEKYTVILHSKLAKKKILERWEKAVREDHPILIIGTKSFLSIPRSDINTIIVDSENSAHYKLQRQPYLDVRKAVEFISKKLKTRLIFGDSLPRTKTFYRRETGDLVSATPPSRMLSGAEQIIVDMKNARATEWQRAKILPIISAKLQEILTGAYEKNEKMLLFINRRGHSSTTVCNDCQKTLLCKKCDTPLVLHKGQPGKIGGGANFVCHKCLQENIIIEQCPYCKSWRLASFGIGIQKIAEEISKQFPKFKLFRIDSDLVKTEKRGREIAESFMSSPGSILIGTEMLFSYIRQPVERVAVVSVDAMFSLPDFSINEKIFRLLLQLRSLAKKTFLIQTRLPEQELFREALRGNVNSFYRTEIENRETFQYPPFKMLIKISRSGKNNAEVKKLIQTLGEKLSEWKPFVYPAFTPKIKGVFVWHLLLKLDPEVWTGKNDLKQKLSSLPQSWKVDVDPESLL